MVRWKSGPLPPDTPPMPTSRVSRLGALLAASSVLVMAVPAAALGGGNEGEGPVFIPTVEPCAAIVGPDRLDAETPRSEVRFRFDVHNCSRNAGKFIVTLRGVQVAGTVPVPCATGATNARTSILGASEANVRMAPPGARPVEGACALGAGEYLYTVTVRDAVTRLQLSSIRFRTTHDSL